jgi:uncharacterized protein DUF3105
MADTRKPKSKSDPTGRNQPGRGAGAAAKTRQRDGRGAPAGGKGRPADKGKLAKGAAARRLQARKRRQRTLVWTTVAVVAVAALVGLIVFQGRDGSPSSAVRPVSPAALEAGRQAAGSDGVKTFAEAGRTHIGPGEQADDWNSNPPTSGDHLATTVGAGVYDNEQDQRALVHNLEHGYVVILYKGIPQDQQDQLRKFVEERGDAKLVLAPSSGLERDGVALTAWRNLETMERVNLDVVQAFVNDYMLPVGTKSTAPEPLAP